MTDLKIFKFVDIYGRRHKYAGYVVDGVATQETIDTINFIKQHGYAPEEDDEPTEQDDMLNDTVKNILSGLKFGEPGNED